MKVMKIFGRLSAVCTSVVLTLLLFSCENRFETDIKLGFTSKNIELESTAGNTNIVVYATGEWSVRLEKPVEWASLSELRGAGNGSFKFSYAANYGTGRIAKVLVDSGGERDTIVITQLGFIPSLTIPNSTLPVDKTGVTIDVPWTTNLAARLDEFEVVYTYESGEDWLSAELTPEFIKITTQTNDSGEERIGRVYLSFQDDLENVATGTITITQGVVDILYPTFEELRAMIPGPTGEITFEDVVYLDGVIISDKESMNVETNPQSGPRAMDLTLNDKTAYMQNEEGTLGVRLIGRTVAANPYRRFDRVRLLLTDRTLVKESNPTRYSLREIRVADIQRTAGTYVAPRRKTIGTLTDEDVYTYVELQDVEVTNSEGSYTNVRDGYAVGLPAAENGNGGIANGATAFYDCVPLSIRDIEGNDMYMLMNMKTLWRKRYNPANAYGDPNAKGVPRGSGTMSGVIVNSKLLRFGDGEVYGEGDIGRYQIRPIEESDINMAMDRADGFTEVLVEWNWDAGVAAIRKDAEAIPNCLPDIYNAANENATLNTTPGVGVSPLPTNEHIDPVFNTSAGLINNCAVQALSNKWWNVGTNKGEGYQFTFSTEGVSTDVLSLNFSMAGNDSSGNANYSSVPVYWEVQYSTDGTNFTPLPNSVFILRTSVFWATTCPLYAAPGHHNYTYKLPAELLGKPEVTVRLVAQSPESSTASTAKGFTWDGTKSTYIRLGVVSIRYNK